MARDVRLGQYSSDQRLAELSHTLAFLVRARENMTAVVKSGTAKMSRAEWTLLALLIASIFVNYIDRGNLSIAAPLIEKELALSPIQIGALLSSFFWTYALLQLLGVAGWLADR